MSDLQIGLIALGVLLILLVLGFNWWQDRRVRRKMQSHFPTSEQDPCWAPGRLRPPARRVASRAWRRRRARIPNSPCRWTPAATPTMPRSRIPPAKSSSRFISPNRPVVPMCCPTCKACAMSAASRCVFATTDQGRHRARIHAGESYAAMSLAVLLANRSGPLTAIEWSQAWARAQDLAERFEATIEGPDQQAVLEQAARLDDTCAALDTQVGLTLLLGGAQPAAEVLNVARDTGFVADGSRLAWPSDNGVAHFTLSRADGAAFDAGMGGIERLYLLLDVPCSPADSRAFGRMVEVGRELAARLRAELVDDQGKPLADGSETVIDERLQVLFGQLEQAGLPAGSARAQRVFA